MLSLDLVKVKSGFGQVNVKSGLGHGLARIGSSLSELSQG